MAEHLKISVSGIRGVVGQPDGLTPELVCRFAAAYGTLCRGGTVLVAGDTRPTGPMVRQALLAGLTAAGCHVIDAGILPTPTVLFAVRHRNLQGGVAVTASHNPPEWNALKLGHPSGRFLNAAEGHRLIGLFESRRFRYARWDRIGSVTTEDPLRPASEHIDRILSLVDARNIRRRRFRVALDPVNGAGCAAVRLLLERLGCRVHAVHDAPNGRFGRGPEPLPEHLTDLSRLVRSTGSDAGFALDPDADRLALVDETGTPLGEEYTLALCVDHILPTTPGPVVINEATSLATERTALRHGRKVLRTKIGEVNVVMRMLASKAAVGGEGNGGLIWPAVGWGRDSLAAIAVVLDAMAKTRLPLSRLKARLPAFHTVKTALHIPTPDPDRLLQRLRNAFPKARFRTLDGVKAVLDDAWVIVRPSNTEPIVRIIAEAPDAGDARRLAETARRALA